MNVIIAGGRDIEVTEVAIQNVVDFLKEVGATTVMSGGAPGGDKIGEEAAKRLGLPIGTYKAQWKLFGKSAGPIRNEEMAKVGHILGYLPGGTGTTDMVNRMLKKGKEVHKLYHK